MERFLFTMFYLVQFVLASLAMWGGIIFGVSKLFGGEKETKTEVFFLLLYYLNNALFRVLDSARNL